MTFKVGDSKPEKAGRRKGVPNKRTNRVLELLDKEGYDPLLEAVRMLKTPNMTREEILLEYESYLESCAQSDQAPEDIKKFIENIEANALTAKDRLDGHIKLIKYVYPSRKAIEVSTEGDKNPPVFTISLTPPKSKNE